MDLQVLVLLNSIETERGETGRCGSHLGAPLGTMAVHPSPGGDANNTDIVAGSCEDRLLADSVAQHDVTKQRCKGYQKKRQGQI